MEGYIGLLSQSLLLVLMKKRNFVRGRKAQRCYKLLTSLLEV